MTEDIVDRLRIRATIRRSISTRKSVQEGKPDRLSDLLEEAALNIENLRKEYFALNHEYVVLEGKLIDTLDGWR